MEWTCRESFIAKLYTVPSTATRPMKNGLQSQMLKIIACELAVLLSSARAANPLQPVVQP